MNEPQLPSTQPWKKAQVFSPGLSIADAQQQHRYNGHGQNGETQWRHGGRNHRAAGRGGKNHFPVATAAPIGVQNTHQQRQENLETLKG